MIDKLNKVEEIKLGKMMVFVDTKFNKETIGIVEKYNEEGYRFSFTRFEWDIDNGEVEEHHSHLLLSVENELDGEDLRNVNEILEENNLSFVGFEEE